MKRKTLTMILCLLTCLSLVGVGFAAWVITAPAEDSVSSDIIVDTVTDKRLTVDAEITSTAKNIIFGWEALESGVTDHNWLKNSDASMQQNLSVTITITVTAKDETIDLKHSDLQVSVLSSAGTLTTGFNQGLLDAIEDKYVSVPTGTIEATKVEDADATDNKVQYTVEFTCAWGDHFKVGDVNLNPYQFYNKDAYSEEKGNDAATALSAIAAIKGSKYSLTVNVVTLG